MRRLPGHATDSKHFAGAGITGTQIAADDSLPQDLVLEDDDATYGQWLWGSVWHDVVRRLGTRSTPLGPIAQVEILAARPVDPRPGFADPMAHRRDPCGIRRRCNASTLNARNALIPT